MKIIEKKKFEMETSQSCFANLEKVIWNVVGRGFWHGLSVCRSLERISPLSLTLIALVWEKTQVFKRLFKRWCPVKTMPFDSLVSYIYLKIGEYQRKLPWRWADPADNWICCKGLAIVLTDYHLLARTATFGKLNR